MADRADLRFFIDFDHDGQFSDDDDVTAFVQTATFFRGMRQPFQGMADESELALVLNNHDRRFSPEYVAGPLYGKLLPQRKVQVQDSDGVALWTGRVETYTPTPMQHGGPFLCTANCIGPKTLMEDTEVDIALLENVTSDVVIAAILEQVEFPPSFTQAWRLGVAGQSELGLTSYLADTAMPAVLETGLTTFPYAGDTWDRFTQAYAAIASVVLAERGKFFFDADGQVVFWNRARLQAEAAIAATIDDTMASLNYGYGDDVVNDVRVTFYPRALSAASTEVLWQTDEPIVLRPEQRRTIRARYAAAEGQQVAGRNVTTPNTGDGSFVADPTVEISTFTAEARSATIELHNDSSLERTVTTLIVRGQKVTSWNAQEVSTVDQESISIYGRRPLTLDVKLLSEPNYALNIAEYEVQRRGRPRGAVRSFVLENRDAARLALQMTLDMGDRVALAETQTGHADEYFIVGKACEWREAGTVFSVTFFVEPAPLFDAWLIGVAGRSELGLTTLLGL